MADSPCDGLNGAIGKAEETLSNTFRADNPFHRPELDQIIDGSLKQIGLPTPYKSMEIFGVSPNIGKPYGDNAIEYPSVIIHAKLGGSEQAADAVTRCNALRVDKDPTHPVISILADQE